MTDDTGIAVAVRVLMDGARLTVSDEEFQRFVKNYPTMRQQADALYRPELRPEAPAVAFDPQVDYSQLEMS